MGKKVIYLETAIEDLSAVYHYISQDSIKYAKLEVQKIRSFCEALTDHPYRGRFFRVQRNK